jgi:acyl carrier protein
MEYEVLKRVIAEVLSVDENEITLETTFADDLDADSLDVTAIVLELEEELGIEISDDDALAIKTVGDAVEKIKAAVAAK